MKNTVRYADLLWIFQQNYGDFIVENHYFATKEIMICCLLVQMASDKKVFHGRPPPLLSFYIYNLRMKLHIIKERGNEQWN